MTIEDAAALSMVRAVHSVATNAIFEPSRAGSKAKAIADAAASSIVPEKEVLPWLRGANKWNL